MRGDVMDWSFHGGGGWGDALDADPADVLADVTDRRISAEAAARYYGAVLDGAQVDRDATVRCRAQLRDQRRGWDRRQRYDALSTAAEGAVRRPMGDKLVVVESVDGTSVFGCDCGELLCPSTADWKDYAGHATLSADDLGAKVRLHPELTADGYACPGCGSLLGVEVRWRRDEPLHDVQVG